MSKKEMKKGLQLAKELTFRNRIQAGMTPPEAAKGIVSVSQLNSFIENMSAVAKVGFLESIPDAQNRLLELLYAKTQIVKGGELVDVDDNNAAIKAAEMIFKYSGIADKKEDSKGSKTVDIMDAIIKD